MKVVILAGGAGSRLGDMSQGKSKAVVDIGGQPILWHLLRYYNQFGFTEFAVALGHHGHSIRDFFANGGYEADRATGNGNGSARERWRDGEIVVDLIETGEATENGGRIKRLAAWLEGERFMLTWCDGLADVDLHALVDFHRDHGRLATLTAVHPPGRFGRLQLDGDRVGAFDEKVIDPEEWINGAFFVLEPGVLDLIAGDGTRFEHDVLARLADDGELMAYRHTSFWRCMDTPKEVRELNALWHDGAPWKIWGDSDAGPRHR